MTRDTRSNSNSKNTVTNDDLKQLINSMKTEILASIDSRLSAIVCKIDTMSAKILDLENSFSSLQRTQMKHAVDIEDMKKEIKGCRDEFVLEAVSELKRREDKKLSLILFGVKELQSGSVNDRQQYDADVCHDILYGLNVSDKSLADIRRIGRLGDRRLLRIKCNSEEQKFELLRKAKGLRFSPNYKSVFVQNDLTVLERRVHRKLTEELTERRSQGQDVVIYRNQVLFRSEVQNFQ